jgi:ParB/Sulfiredoxin domain
VTPSKRKRWSDHVAPLEIARDVHAVASVRFGPTPDHPGDGRERGVELMPAKKKRAAQPTALPAPYRYAAKIKLTAIDLLKPYPRNPRTHPKRQIKQIATSLERFGCTNAVLIDENNQVLCGHGRLAAAQMLGWKQIPTVRIDYLRADPGSS